MELDQLIVRIEADAKPLVSALEGIDKQASHSLTRVASLSDRIGNSFVSAAVRGEGLSGVLRGIVRDLANVTLRDTVVSPIGDLVGGFIGSLFGRASGGSVSPGQPYLVGERGPELFVPSSAGRVDNSVSTGAPSVSISIDARGADAGAASRLSAAADEIQERTFRAVFAAMERGGRYAKISGRRQ